MNLTAQMGENTAASDNVNNAISFNQTQDGYLQQVNNALDRMSELSVQAQDVTKSNSDRSLYQPGVQHVGQLTSITWPRRTSTGSACSDGGNPQCDGGQRGGHVHQQGRGSHAAIYSSLASDSIATTTRRRQRR